MSPFLLAVYTHLVQVLLFYKCKPRVVLFISRRRVSRGASDPLDECRFCSLALSLLGAYIYTRYKYIYASRRSKTGRGRCWAVALG